MICIIQYKVNGRNKNAGMVATGFCEVGAAPKYADTLCY